MNIKVDPDWWKTLFDDVYLVTDARSVDNEQVTRQEIDLVRQLIPLEPDDRILDLCGGHGRHSLELARRGHRGCTVFDYSQRLLEIGESRARQQNCEIRFVQGDARDTGMPADRFDHVLVLGNSLGYIAEPEADLAILRETLRVLRPQGWLLLDVSDGEMIRKKIAPNAWHEIGDDVVVCRLRELDGRMICAREMVLSKSRGEIRDKSYCIRLYEGEELGKLVSQAGYANVKVHTDLTPFQKGRDLGCMNHRLILCAQKP